MILIALLCILIGIYIIRHSYIEQLDNNDNNDNDNDNDNNNDTSAINYNKYLDKHTAMTAMTAVVLTLPLLMKERNGRRRGVWILVAMVM